jgi:cellulose biosynthesis protein BcsQ
VLAIDLDPQGTRTLGTLGDRTGQGTAEALGYGISAAEEPPGIAMFATAIPAFGFDLLASNVDRLTSCDESLRANSARQMLLTQQLADVEDTYDMVVLDSPPSLGALTMTGIYASDSVLVPVDASAESLHGLGLLKVTLQRTRAIKKDLKILGAVVTKFNARATVDTSVLSVMEADGAFPFVQTIRLTNQGKDDLYGAATASTACPDRRRRVLGSNGTENSLKLLSSACLPIGAAPYGVDTVDTR